MGGVIYAGDVYLIRPTTTASTTTSTTSVSVTTDASSCESIKMSFSFLPWFDMITRL